MTARSPTMVTLYDTRFVECRWWNDGWTVKTRHLTVIGLYDTGPRGLLQFSRTYSSVSPISTRLQGYSHRSSNVHHNISQQIALCPPSSHRVTDLRVRCLHIPHLDYLHDGKRSLTVHVCEWTEDEKKLTERLVQKSLEQI